MSLTQIGPWRFDADANELVDGGQTARLTPKASLTLKLLADAPGQVLSRSTLTDQVGLSDEGLSRIINELREALRDQARNSRYIQTIPRRGYRLRADVAAPAAPSLPDSTERSMGRWLVGLLLAALLVGMLANSARERGGGKNTADAVATTSVPTDSAVSVALPEAVTRLTSGIGAAQNPVLDGRQVWFDLADVTGANSRAGQRVSLGSLANEAGDWPDEVRHVHPGKRYLAIIRDNAQGCTTQLMARDRSTPPQSALPCDSASALPHWSGDGKTLTQAGPEGGIDLIHAEDNVRRQRTTPLAPLRDLNPRFHPDGETLSFIRSDGLVGELMMQNPNGDMTALTDDHQMVFGHAWIDDQHVIMSSDRTGVRQLWLLNVQTSQWRSYGQAGVMGMDYQAPDLVFEIPTFRADIWRWDGTHAKAVVTSQHYDNHPRLSPDGSALAFVSTRSGTTGLWVSAADGSNAQLKVDLTEGRITRPWWRNNNELIYVVYQQRGSEARSLRLTGGSSKTLVPRQFQPREVITLPSGEVYFVGIDDVTEGIFQWLGDRAMLVQAGDFARLETDQRGNLYVSPTTGNQVNQLNPGGQPLKKAQLPTGKTLEWTIGGDWLYYLASDGVRRQSLSQPINQRTSAPAPSSIGLSLGASANGDELYIAQFHSVQIDLMHTQFTLDP